MPAGRKTKDTPETRERILNAIRVGSTIEHACQSGGIVFQTFSRWRKTNNEFNQAVEKAQGDAVVRRLARIEKAGQEGKWQADAWWLERRYPQEWGRTIQEHQGPDGKPVQIQIVEVLRDKHGDR